MFHVSTSKNKEDRDIEAQWSRFLNGYWTLEKPPYPGYYIVCARDGGFAKQKFFKTLDKVKEWEGFFWTVPLPPPPKEVPVSD